MQTPSIGRVVLVLVDPAENNGSDVAPAIITRVWGLDPGDANRWLVNYRILLDGPETPWRPSGYLYAIEEDARDSGCAPQSAAFWPPRV